MSRNRRITVSYTDGTQEQMVVSRGDEMRAYPDEGYLVAHFGRDDGDGWSELAAAPLASIRSWS